jgi:hypothetical protein
MKRTGSLIRTLLRLSQRVASWWQMMVTRRKGGTVKEPFVEMMSEFDFLDDGRPILKLVAQHQFQLMKGSKDFQSLPIEQWRSSSPKGAC